MFKWLRRKTPPKRTVAEGYGPLFQAGLEFQILKSRALEAGPPIRLNYDSDRAYVVDCKVWRKWKLEQEAQEAKRLGWKYYREIETELDPYKRYREAREEFTAT